MISGSPYAPVSLHKPQPWGVCDRCGFRYLLGDLAYQHEWRGLTLANLRIRVCPECLDKPQDQLRPVLIGPDPVPVQDPRPGYASTQMGLPVSALVAVQIRGASGNQPPYATGAPLITAAVVDVNEALGGHAGILFDTDGEPLLDTSGKQLWATQSVVQNRPLLPNTADRPGYPDQLYDTKHRPLTDDTIPPWTLEYANLTPLQARLYGTVNHAPGQTEVLPSPPFKNDPRYVVLDD